MHLYAHPHADSHRHPHHHSRRDFFHTMLHTALAGAGVLEIAASRAVWAQALSREASAAQFEISKVAENVYFRARAAFRDGQFERGDFRQHVECHRGGRSLSSGSGCSSDCANSERGHAEAGAVSNRYAFSFRSHPGQCCLHGNGQQGGYYREQYNQNSDVQNARAEAKSGHGSCQSGTTRCGAGRSQAGGSPSKAG